MPERRSLRVLIVDDNRDAADSTAELLALHGYEARVANTGSEALHVVDSFPPDVVLLDISLPREDGYVVAKKLCDRLKRKPILVAMTGYHHLKDRSNQEGFDHHCVKPVDPCALTDLMEGYAKKQGS